MLLARSIVSLTGHLPRISSSSGLVVDDRDGSSREIKSWLPLLFPLA